MSFILIALVIGIIPAFIAKNKGRSFIGWWIYGALLFIVALPNSILTKSKGVKKCPFCAEEIKTEATICKLCNKQQ